AAGGMKPAPRGRHVSAAAGGAGGLQPGGGCGGGGRRDGSGDAAPGSAKESVIPLHEGRVYHRSAPHHFCYTNTRVPQWHDVWTRTQIRVNSSRMIRVTQVGSEEELEEFSQGSAPGGGGRGCLPPHSLPRISHLLS
uniref:Uncharacterized protein n=1 Tax=Strix occidentalis caurina TaxID=311401 RepID=A0A8D0FU76_STROC